LSKELWYKRTEGKLYAYPGIESSIINLEAQLKLLDANMVPPRAQTYNRIGPPTTGGRMSEPEQYAQDRGFSRDKVLAKIALKKADKFAIDEALKMLSAEQRSLVENWYFKSWSLVHPEKKIWQELAINRDTFFNRKKLIICIVARYLGETLSSD
jgi:DUF1680 family protein